MSQYPQFKTLGDISRFHAEAHGEHTALVFEGRTTNYRQLDQYANQVASGLMASAATGNRVAVLSRNNDYFFELLMGMGKCGAVLTAINWRLAPPEVQYIIADSESRILFIEACFLPLLETIRDQLPLLTTAIVFDADVEGIEEYVQWRNRQSTSQCNVSVCGDDVAMQLYTSGTTGRPKGVQLTHRGLLSLRSAEHLVAPWSQWGDTDVALVAMPLFHIGGTATGLIALYNASAAIIMREVDPGEIIRLIQSYKVTRTFLVPAVIRLLLDHPDCEPGVFESLKILLYGASPIPAALLQRAVAVMPCGFAQIYGMTETAGSMTVLHPADHADPQAKKMGSCGKPYPNIEIAIVDQAGNKLGADQVGEIIINSPSLMSGYWKLPEATNSTLRGGWLYTGDAGYLDDEGYLYIYDRMKDMIVSGAENIYPAEVESVLYAHPDVDDVAVIGVPDEKWGEAVKAVVVKTPDSALNAEELIQFSRNSIAGYKLPKTVDFVAQLPRNTSGKLLKKDIRKPYWQDMNRRIN
jgi:long-chain acyl-CoA synthetase